MYSDGLLKLPIFIIQKNFKILLTVYSLSPRYVERAAVAALVYVVPVVLVAHRGITSRPQDVCFSPAAVPD